MIDFNHAADTIRSKALSFAALGIVFSVIWFMAKSYYRRKWKVPPQVEFGALMRKIEHDCKCNWLVACDECSKRYDLFEQKIERGDG